MIQSEIITIGTKEFKKTYSDEGYYIRKIGTEEIYEEAIDILTATYEYEETDQKINPEESSSATEEGNEAQPEEII